LSVNMLRTVPRLRLLAYLHMENSGQENVFDALPWTSFFARNTLETLVLMDVCLTRNFMSQIRGCASLARFALLGECSGSGREALETLCVDGACPKLRMLVVPYDKVRGGNPRLHFARRSLFALPPPATTNISSLSRSSSSSSSSSSRSPTVSRSLARDAKKHHMAALVPVEVPPQTPLAVVFARHVRLLLPASLDVRSIHYDTRRHNTPDTPKVVYATHDSAALAQLQRRGCVVALTTGCHAHVHTLEWGPVCPMAKKASCSCQAAEVQVVFVSTVTLMGLTDVMVRGADEKETRKIDKIDNMGSQTKTRTTTNQKDENAVETPHTPGADTEKYRGASGGGPHTPHERHHEDLYVENGTKRDRDTSDSGTDSGPDSPHEQHREEFYVDDGNDVETRHERNRCDS